VLGKANSLLTSFDARPGDDLLMAVDLRGSWRAEKPFWNASVGAPAERLRGDLELLPVLAESGLCKAAKDISNGGIVGTLAMLLECSGVGAELWLDQLPQPPGVDLERWLIAFPSFGYLLSVPPENTPRVTAHFAAREIACAAVGRVTASPSLVLGYGAARAPFPLAAASDPRATSL
jgi:selenophosphate synthetase-related protein